MAYCKTTARKQVTEVPSSKHPEIDSLFERPSESHNDGKTASYFLRELRSLLNTLDYHDEPLYIGKKTPLCNRGDKWEVRSSMRSPKVLESAMSAEFTTPLP
jgi:hypothetical protein